MSLTQKGVGIRVFGFRSSYIFEGASIYGDRRYVVGGLQSTSYNHKNQTLIFKNLKELQKTPKTHT